MKHKGDTDNIFDPRLHQLFKNVNQFDCLINVTPQSQRSFVLSPSLYSFCLLCRYSVYSDAIRYSVYSADIRNSSIYEFTWIHRTRKRQLFRYTFIIIASTREVFSSNYSSYLQISINQPLVLSSLMRVTHSTSGPFVHWQCQSIFWSTDQSGKRAPMFDRKYTHLHLYLYVCTLSLLRQNIILEISLSLLSSSTSKWSFAIIIT